MATSPAPAIDTGGDPDLQRQDAHPAGRARQRRRNGHRHPEAARRDRPHHARSGLRQHGRVPSAITFIDGEKGHPALPRLRHRGAGREEHVPRGRLAAALRRAADGRASWRASPSEVTQHTMLHENFRRFFEALPKDAHPMPVCAAAVAALATFYQGAETERRQPARDRRAPHREDADDRRLLVQALDRPAVHLSEQPARATPRTSCT